MTATLTQRDSRQQPGEPSHCSLCSLPGLHISTAEQQVVVQISLLMTSYRPSLNFD